MNPNKIRYYLDLAAKVSREKEDGRTYYHGAVGLRNDGVMVCASNGNPKFPTPEHHCEFRILRKLGRKGVIFLARTLADGRWANSEPCPQCQSRLRNSMIKIIYYTVGIDDFGWWKPSTDERNHGSLRLGGYKVIPAFGYTVIPAFSGALL